MARKQQLICTVKAHMPITVNLPAVLYGRLGRKKIVSEMTCFVSEQYTGYHIQEGKIFGSIGYTGWRIEGTRIFAPDGTSDYRVELGKIYGPSGDTGCQIIGTSIY